jgi:hypothetical protein
MGAAAVKASERRMAFVGGLISEFLAAAVRADSINAPATFAG